jgi:hypothetical protein
VTVPGPHASSRYGFGAARVVAAAIAVSVALPAAALAVTAEPIPALPTVVGLDPIVDDGPAWASLSARQRSILAPLQDDWPNITAYQKDQWLELAARYPALNKAEQARIRERMADWARLSAAERGRARLNFQTATQQPATDRQARWEAYKALPPDERERLREQASRTAAGATPPSAKATAAAARPDTQGGTRAPSNVSISRTSATKSNIVPNALHAARPPRPVSASMVQAVPGATTTLVTKRPAPPLHQQTGMPKIAATPSMVDPTTLLPRRGPQAAVLPVPPRPARRDKDD